MVSEKLGAAFIEVGVDLGPLEKGLSSAQGMMQHAGTNMAGGLKSSLQSGNFADVGRQLGGDLVGGLTSQFGMLGQAAGTLATALGPVGVALLGIGAAVVGVGAIIKSSVGVAADFQQSMANVASVTGGGAEGLKALSDAAREAGASTVFSAMEAADAQYFLASAGMSTDEIIASLGDTLLLAGAGGLEMGRAAEIVTNSLSQFNMEASESGRIANVLAAAAAGSNTTVSQMGVGMAKVGPIANALGMSFEQTSASLMVLANAGIKGEEGGTMLRGVLSSLMDVSPKAAEALAEMGLSAEDIDPALHSIDEIMVKLNESGMTASQAVKIFGREASSAAINLAAGAKDIKGYEEAITGTSKAQEMYNQQTDTFNGAMKMLGSAISEAKISLGNVFLPVLTDAVKWMADGVTAATNLGKALFGMYESAKLFAGEKIVEPGKGLIDRGIAGLAGTFGFDAVAAYYAGEEIGSDLAAGIEAGIDGVGDAVTGELESADGEGAGKKVGADFVDGMTEALRTGKPQTEAQLQYLNSFTPSGYDEYASKKGTAAFTSGGVEYTYRWDTSGRQMDFWLYANGKPISKLIGMRQTATPEDLLKEAGISGPLPGSADWYDMMGAALSRPGVPTGAGAPTSEGSYAMAFKLRLEPDFDMEAANKTLVDQLAREWEEIQNILDEQAELHQLDIVFGMDKHVGAKMKELGEEAIDAFADGLTVGEANDLISRAAFLDDFRRNNPDIWAEVGNESADVMIDAILAGDWEGLGALIGDRTGDAMEKTLFGRELRMKDIPALSDLIADPEALKKTVQNWEQWSSNTYQPALQHHIDEAEAKYASGYYSQSELNKDYFRDLMTNALQYSDWYEGWQLGLLGAYARGDIGLQQFFDLWENGGKAIEGASKAIAAERQNLAGLTAEASVCEEAMSAFGIAQEKMSDQLFNRSYIGPTSGYAAFLEEERARGAYHPEAQQLSMVYRVEADTEAAEKSVEDLRTDIDQSEAAPQIDAITQPAYDAVDSFLGWVNGISASVFVDAYGPGTEYTRGGGYLEGLSPGITSSPGWGTSSWLPVLDSGGIVTGPTIASLAQDNRPEAIIPLDQISKIIGGGGGPTYNISVNGGGNAEEIARAIRGAIEDYDREKNRSGAYA